MSGTAGRSFVPQNERLVLFKNVNIVKYKNKTKPSEETKNWRKSKESKETGHDN